MRQAYSPMLAVAALLLFLLSGCGQEMKLVAPVEGTLKVGDKTIEKGSITLHPDKTKGNELEFPSPPVGELNNGSFTIFTNGKPGAPAGWYKVTVNSSVPSDPKNEYSAPKLLVDKLFTEPFSTPLTMEVKEDAPAGHYDLRVN